MATKLEEFRKKYPAYDNISDRDLADALYTKYYSSGETKLDQNDFYRKIGLGAGEPISEAQSMAEQQDAISSAFYTAPKEGTLGQRPTRRTERERLESEIQALTESRRRRLEEEASPSEQAQQAQAMEGAFYSKPPEMTVEQYFEEQSKALQRAEARAVEEEKKKESQDKTVAAREKAIGPQVDMIKEAMDEYKDPNTPWYKKAILFFNVGQMAQATGAPSAAAIGRRTAVEAITSPVTVAGLVTSALSPDLANKIYESDVATKLSNLKDSLAGDVTPSEELVSDIATLFIGSGLAKGITKKALTSYTENVNKQFGREVAQRVERQILESTGQKMAVKPKAISAKQEKSISTGSNIAATATGVAIDVQLSDREQFAVELMAQVPELEPIAEALRVNPQDTEAQEKLKRLAESSALTGVVASVFKGVPALVSAVTSASSKMKGVGQAASNGALNVPQPSPNAVVTQSSLVQTPSGKIEQRNIIVETIARINTSLGRAFKSTANLPNEIFEAYVRKSNAGRAYELELKRVAKDLDSSKKEFKVSDADFNAYMNDGIDNGLPQQLKTKIDEFRTTVQNNQSRINQELGLTGTDALGVGYKNGEIYITRTFEATDNPAYLQKIKDALEGRAAPVADAEFIAKVKRARGYLLQQITADPASKTAKNFLALSAEQKQATLDSAIYSMVQNLSGENKTFVKKLMDGSLAANNIDVIGSLVKVLRTRKEIDKPILDLLGEVKDPIRNAVTTLQNQNKLLAEIEYIKAVEAFANQNADTVIDIGGLFKFLPSVRTKFSSTPIVGGKTLEEVSRESIGKFGGGGKALADIYTTPQMADYIANGTNLWNWNNKLGSGIGNMFAKVSGFGQATQTVLDLPAYVVNTMGAATTLAANGHILSPAAWKNVFSNINVLTQQVRANDKNAIKYLQTLKQQGVLDTDITGEVLSRNANVLGSSPTNFLSKAYVGGMQKLGAFYGQPDNYMKLLAHQSEMTSLKKMFPNMTQEELVAEASKRVRDTMPTYGVSSPVVRELSKLPFGTYALYPTEVFRTSKNIIKYAVGDVASGLANGNGAQLANGLKRLTAMGTVLAGPELYARTNNKSLGVTDENLRAVEALAPEWGKGSTKFFLNGFEEGKDGSIKPRYASSSAYDAYDVLKTPVRLLTGKVLAGKEVKQFEVDEALKGMLSSVTDPYTNPKFFTEALMNVVSNIDMKTGKPIYESAVGTTMLDKIKAASLELAKSLEPGTSQVIRTYIESLESEKLRGLYEGINASGFPLSSRDIETWAKTGIRPTTMNLDKSIGFNLSKDIKAIQETEPAFMKFVSQTTDQKYTPELGKKIVDEFRKYQERKLEGMINLKDKLDLFQRITYTDKNGKEQQYNYGRIVSAITDKGQASTRVPQELTLAKGGAFIPDSVFNKADLKRMLIDKEYPIELLRELQKVTVEFSGKKLVREKKE
jgi:hypothetical protein